MKQIYFSVLLALLQDISAGAAEPKLPARVALKEEPWRVRIAFDKVTTCSGAIIYPNWILAPRSCFTGYPTVRQVEVYAGGVCHNDSQQHGTADLLPDINTHPQLVLLKMRSKFTYDSYVKDIALPFNWLLKEINFAWAKSSGWNIEGDITRLVSFQVFTLPSSSCTPAAIGSSTPAPVDNYASYCASSYDWSDITVNHATIDFMDYYDEASQKYFMIGVRSGEMMPCSVSGKDKCVKYAYVDTCIVSWIGRSLVQDDLSVREDVPKM